MNLEKINFIKKILNNLSFRLLELYNSFNFKDKIKNLKLINEKLLILNSYRDYNRIKYYINKKQFLKKIIKKITRIDISLKDINELFMTSILENDFSLLNLIENDIKNLDNLILKMEFFKFFKNPLDKKNCFIDIKAGAGGIEAQDWAFILLRQYLKYCEKKKFKVKILDQSYGEIAGIKTSTIKIKGKYAYGFLKNESGVHRLVRKSPFNSLKNRHTSFTSLFVYPDINNSINIKINSSDVRIDTYKASGAGGQHINKTDSAIRLTHKPTKIVVQCQKYRSQHRNRLEAWNMLKSKLFNLEHNKKNKKKKKIENSKSDVKWGQQIRSYILDKSLIKDLRTNYETNNVKAILDGKIENFIFAYLKLKI